MRYEIKGGNFPVAVCDMEAGESIVCQAGGMAWIRGDIRMETKGGGIGKMFGRAFSGESMFQNRYSARSRGQIAFAASSPGEIRAVQIAPGRSVIAQKGSFLASDEGVELSVYLQKKVGAGFFGGEGFIMQKLSGHGVAFLEIDGSVVEYDLRAGQQLVVNTGNVALIDATCSINVQQVKGVKNVLFGGEGLFNTVITGPGRVVLQTMPLSGFVSTIAGMLPSSSN